MQSHAVPTGPGGGDDHARPGDGASGDPASGGGAAIDDAGSDTAAAGIDADDTAGATPSAGPVDWEAVRYDYQYCGMSQRWIAWKHGISRASFQRRKDKERWERIEPLARRTSRVAQPKDGVPPTPTEQRRLRIVTRLYNLLEAKMSEFERRMEEAGGRPQSPAEAERDARSLNALARLYATLADIDAARETRAAGLKKPNDRKDGAHADRLRRDLAGRLARLQPGHD